MRKQQNNKRAARVILILLLLSLIPFNLLPISDAVLVLPGTTFTCENQYYSVHSSIPAGIDFYTISVSTHWVGFNNISFNITFGGTKLWNNISSITSNPLTNNGWIINWTQQKTAWAATSDYWINGLKPSYDYILYSNGSGTAHSTTAGGVLLFSSAITSRNRNYALYDPGIPAEWYVATTGSDTTGSGSILNPFATLQKAINASSTSDTIYIRGGNYLPGRTTFVNRSGVLGDWYTISGYPGETAIINGTYCNYGDKSINATIMIRDCDYVRITNLVINRSRVGGISMYSSPATCNYIRIDNCTISNNSGFAIRSYISNTYHYIENNYLYNNFCNWTGLSGYSQETISLSGVSHGYIYGNTLWKNHVEQIDMKSGCNWMYVYNNTINMTASRIYRNMYMHGGIGIYIDARGVSHNVSIYNNHIYGNNTAIQLSNEGATGRIENITVYNNVINVTNTTGGAPTGTGRLGILIGREGGSTSVNKDIKIYMNTIHLGPGNKYPCLQVGSVADPITTSYIRRLNISNNIFTNNNKTSTSWWQYLNTAHIQMEGLSSTDGSTYIKFNNNLFNNSFTGTCAPRIDWADAAYTKTSPAKWGNSPLFTKPEYASPNPPCDFRLNATSPAIGAATSILVATTDYDGNIRPQAGTYDIGAYEYIGGGGTAYAPVQATPVPTNGTTTTLPLAYLNITATDQNADTMNIYFYSNYTGAWALLSSNLTVNNGTYQSLLPGITGTGWRYWRVSVTDGTVWTNATYRFYVSTPTENIVIHRVRANWTTNTAINITWTKGANCTNTLIYRSETGYMNIPSLIYSGTLSYYNDTLKNPTIRYYYTLYPYNSVSALYGTPVNAILAETDNATTYGSTWLNFPGYLATDKSVKANYHYSTEPGFGSTTINITGLDYSYNGTAPYTSGTYYNLYWFGQTFKTGTQKQYIYNVSIHGYRAGSPGLLYCRLYSANATGLPTGVSLANGTKDVSTVVTHPSTQWITVEMPAYLMNSNTQYAIMFSISGSPANILQLNYDNSPTMYPKGNLTVSSDGGVTFTNSTAYDALFRINTKTPYTYPLGGLITTNSTIATSTTYSITQNDLSEGQLYYYYAAANDTKGNMTKGNNRYSLTRPGVPVFTNIIPNFGNSSVNISWITGVGANRTVLVYSNTAYPTTPAGGTVAYNGTGSYDIVPSIMFNTTYYFTMFSFTVWGGHSRFSSGVTIPWGGVTFIVRNESKPWQLINATITVTDSEGLHPTQFTSTYGYYSFNISSIPYGTNTLFYVQNVSYDSRLYPVTIIPNLFYNLTFYLPPLVLPGNGTTGWNMVQIIDEQSLPLPGVLVQFYRYMNYTSNYSYIGGFVSDGNGQGSISLFPYQLYMIKLSKDGYQNRTEFWTPNVVEQGLIKYFKLYYELPTAEDIYYFTEEIHITGELQNSTGILYVNYTDDLALTESLTIYVIDLTNGTVMLTDVSTNQDVINVSVVVNNTHDYEVAYYLWHTYFGYKTGSVYVGGWHVTITTESRFNTLFAINFGFNPFGWSNVVMWFVLLGCFFSFQRRDTWMVMFLIGFLSLAINYYIGFNTALSLIAGGAIPIVFILFGILMLIRDRHRFGVDL